MELSALAPTRARRQNVHLTTNATWTKEEDELLTQMVSQTEVVAWSTLAKYFPNKTAPQLAGRWEKVLNPCLIKGSWTRDEDEIILTFVKDNGDKDWAKLALLLKGRTGKQCRERFKNHLDPSVAKNEWTEDEDKLLIDMHEKMGNAWTRIASFFEGRTDNCIKNRWNSTLKKRIERSQRGEPLVMKRGRKPKSYYDSIAKPDFTLNNSQYSAGCSSPVHTINSIPFIEMIPFSEQLPLCLSRKNSMQPKQVLTLEQNRLYLQQMLNASFV